MFPLLLVATGWTLVGAADVVQSGTYNRNENAPVAEDALFQSPADSTLRCASLCQQQDGCEAFAFDQKTCSGHRMSNTTDQSATRTRLFVKELGERRELDPCSNYTVLDDSKRNVNNGNERLCDRDLTPGWYRFFLLGNDAVMPTECVPGFHCGTEIPYWLDLQGGGLPAVGHETAARACGRLYSNCCRSQTPVTVRNCSAFLLYKLEPTSACTDAYCAKDMNS